MTRANEVLVQVTAPHFCAGLVLVDDIVVEAAPILRKMAMGRPRAYLSAEFKRRGWKAVIVKQGEVP